MMMVWHIFKKDWKLLWRIVVVVGALQFVSASTLVIMGQNRESQLLKLALLLLGFTLLGAAFLIATVVQQDAIPGVRQDWLVRPLRRRDLLLAKLLFVLTTVQGPICAADLTEALINGFPVRQSLHAAVSRSILLLIGCSLPMVALASLTRGITETIVAVVVAFLGYAVFALLSGSLNQGGKVQLAPTINTGEEWVSTSVALALALLGASVVLGLQYSRRKTVFARWLAAGVGFLCLLTKLMPWRPAFAVQQQLSPNPGAGSPIVMTFEPSLGRYRPSGVNPDDMSMIGTSKRMAVTSVYPVYLPLHIAGLPSDVVLQGDRSEMRLITADGKTVYHDTAGDLQVHQEGPANGEARIHQGLPLQRSLYDRIKEQPLRLGNSYAIPALGGDERMPGLGRCRTQMDDEGDEIHFRCIDAGKQASCFAAFLEHAPSGRRNPERLVCRPYYPPYPERYFPDAMSRRGVEIPFHDLAGLVHYPVDSPQLPESRVVLRVYEPQDHFRRHLMIPDIRLKDWEAQ
jgi:hypothetical protein